MMTTLYKLWGLLFWISSSLTLFQKHLSLGVCATNAFLKYIFPFCFLQKDSVTLCAPRWCCSANQCPGQGMKRGFSSTDMNRNTNSYAYSYSRDKPYAKAKWPKKKIIFQPFVQALLPSDIKPWQILKKEEGIAFPAKQRTLTWSWGPSQATAANSSSSNYSTGFHTY